MGGWAITTIDSWRSQPAAATATNGERLPIQQRAADFASGDVAVCRRRSPDREALRPARRLQCALGHERLSCTAPRGRSRRRSAVERSPRPPRPGADIRDRAPVATPLAAPLALAAGGGGGCWPAAAPGVVAWRGAAAKPEAQHRIGEDRPRAHRGAGHRQRHGLGAEDRAGGQPGLGPGGRAARRLQRSGEEGAAAGPPGHPAVPVGGGAGARQPGGGPQQRAPRSRRSCWTPSASWPAAKALGDAKFLAQEVVDTAASDVAVARAARGRGAAPRPSRPRPRCGRPS